MEPAKSFNNVIIGQFALTGVPVQVYVQGRFLIITDVEDVDDPNIGFGMDEDGEMVQFDYRAVEQLSVSGNAVTLDTYNKGMGATEEEPAEEEPAKEEDDAESDKLPKEAKMNLKDLIKEISKDEADAEVEGAEAAIDAAKAKLKAAQASMKNTVKTSKEKIKAARSQPIDEDHQSYTFGVGDIVKNKNTSCPHHGSIGVVKKIMELPNEMGTVAIYTVMNSGRTYKAGDSLTKTIDQLEPITALGTKE
jgi:hypothetical protein